MKKAFILMCLFAAYTPHLKGQGKIPSVATSVIVLAVPAIYTGIYCPAHMGGEHSVKRKLLFDSVFFSTALALNAIFGTSHNQPGKPTRKKWFDSARDAFLLTAVSRCTGECMAYFFTKLFESAYTKAFASWGGPRMGHNFAYVSSWVMCMRASITVDDIDNWPFDDIDDWPLYAIGSVIPPLVASLALLCCKNMGII